MDEKPVRIWPKKFNECHFDVSGAEKSGFFWIGAILKGLTRLS
jgi:hypothetical protein